MTRPTLPYARQWVDQDDVEAVVAQLKGDWLTQGPRVAELEGRLAELTGARYAVAVSSGTAALHLAALVAGVGPGTVGVTSANTFVASANCIAYCGGQPVLVDVDPSTGLVALPDLERACDRLAQAGTPPRVLIPVDFGGQPPDLAAVRALADRHGSVVIEDAAHALGGTYESEGCEVRCGSCTHTEMAILSFHPVKHITSGEGGAVLTNDRVLHARLTELRSHGITRDPARLRFADGPWYYEQQELGFNYRLTDIQCALAISQLRRLPLFLERRRHFAGLYDAAFRQPPLEGLIGPLAQRGGTLNAYHLYVARLVRQPGETSDDLAARRRKLFEQLRASGINPQIHYIPVTRQPWYRDHAATRPEEYPGAEAYYASCISLPLFPAMSDEDVERVVTELSRSLSG